MKILSIVTVFALIVSVLGGSSVVLNMARAQVVDDIPLVVDDASLIDEIPPPVDLAASESQSAGTISGMKFNDLNGNGEKDGDETGLANWTIKLIGPAGDNSTMVTTTTDGDGNYSFTDLSGTYTLCEEPQNGWTQTYPTSATNNWIPCDDNSDGYSMVGINSSSNITNVNFGNQQNPVGEEATLTIVKHSIGGDDSFDFLVTATSTQKALPQFVNLETEDGYATSSDLSLDPGIYDVMEASSSEWTLTDVYCDYENQARGIFIPAGGEEITVDDGDHVTCTFTNTSTSEEATSSHIIVHKSTNLDEETPTEFDFTTTGEDGFSQNFVLSDGETIDMEVPAGTSTITEGEDFPGWTLNSVNCQYENQQAGNEAPHGHVVYLDPGDTVSCNFYNHYNNSENEGHLIVKKVLVNAPESANASDFSFIINDGDSHDFDNDGENDITLNSGTYSVTEPAVDGYTTTYDNCSDLNIENGETVTCTITNTVPTPPQSGGGGGTAPNTGGGNIIGGGTVGSVLGTSTGPTIDTSGGTCSAYLTKYMRYGRKNDSNEVKKLQTFLNEFQNAGLPVTGFFGQLTLGAVKAFQVSQETYIRNPWSNVNLPILNSEWPTGQVYKTTLWRINQLKCDSLHEAVPQLP